MELDAEQPITVVGMKYQPDFDFLSVKRLGTAILLVPEPANQYDSNAIACYVTKPTGDSYDNTYTWVKAGYIAKSETCLIRDRSKVYEGKIASKNRDYWCVRVHSDRQYN